jgi:hypothetical protein
VQGDTEVTQEDRKRARREKKEKHKKETSKKAAITKARQQLDPRARKPTDKTQDVIKQISKDKRVTIADPSATGGGRASTRSKEFFSKLQESKSSTPAASTSSDGFSAQSNFLKL